jgi:hypothetical protein
VGVSGPSFGPVIANGVLDAVVLFTAVGVVRHCDPAVGRSAGWTIGRACPCWIARTIGDSTRAVTDASL